MAGAHVAGHNVRLKKTTERWHSGFLLYHLISRSVDLFSDKSVGDVPYATVRIAGKMANMHFYIFLDKL